MDTSEEILRQLRWIKWFTALSALSFVAIAATLAWTAHEATASFDRTSKASGFTARANALLEEGKPEEVLVLCDEHEKSFPKDAYVDWYRGKAYYQLGRYPEALKAMQRADELSPNWRQGYTGPYIKAIEEKLARKR